jgi:hypothetical protein
VVILIWNHQKVKPARSSLSEVFSVFKGAENRGRGIDCGVKIGR